MTIDTETFARMMTEGVESVQGDDSDTGDSDAHVHNDIDSDIDTDVHTDTDTDAHTDVDTDVDTTADSDGDINTDTTQAQPFKNEHNAQMAAQRRRQEEQQRIQKARDEVFKEAYAGQVNPYNNQPINSEADYRAYQQMHAREQMRQAGVTDADIQQVVDADPRIQQAQQMIQENARFAQMQQQMAQRQEIERALGEINKVDPSIKTADDLIANPHFAEIEQMWKRGLHLDEAFYLTNRGAIERRAQEAAQQQALNQVTSKKHLKSTQGGAGDEVVVPDSVLEAYQAMNPKATMQEIKEHYKRSQKRKG